MTHPLRSTGITPLQHYKETDSPPQLDSDEAAMTYERFIRCGSAKPVANYYEAVRPSPVDQDSLRRNLLARRLSGSLLLLLPARVDCGEHFRRRHRQFGQPP